MKKTTETGKISASEELKQGSNFLRGEIGKDLADATSGCVTEGSAQLLKFHGTYQQDDRDVRAERNKLKQEKAYMFLVRIRITGGAIRPQQWTQIDDLSNNYGNGTIKLTTRQTVQLHGIVKSDLKTTMRGINQAAMNTIATCGDVNRNVMCNPNPHESQVRAEVLELANTISARLTPATRAYYEIFLDGEPYLGGEPEAEPLYGKTYLPRKFKIAIAIPPDNDVDVFANDLSFIAIVKDEKIIGYNVAAGGGMGMSHNNEKTYPRVADVIGFCTPDQVITVAENVVKVQRDNGDRGDRKHARLKYTIDDRGIKWFVSELEKYQGFKLQAPKPFAFTRTGDRMGWTHGKDGAWHLTLCVDGGRVCDKDGVNIKAALRELTEKHKYELRLTGNQNVIIADVAAAQKAEVEAVLAKHGVDQLMRRGGLRSHSMACVALPTCGLALAEAERFLPAILTQLETILAANGLEKQAITMRLTGCPNGCARPFLGEIGIVGRAPGKYNVYLGGGHAGERLNVLYKESVPDAELASVLEPIISRYAKERQDGESFGDFVVRAGYVSAASDHKKQFSADAK